MASTRVHVLKYTGETLEGELISDHAKSLNGCPALLIGDAAYNKTISAFAGYEVQGAIGEDEEGLVDKWNSISKRQL